MRTAKQDVMSCYDAIPNGTIFLLDGGHGVPLRACTHHDPPGCGIWLMGAGDPNYQHPPAGWRKLKSISFVGGMGTTGGAFSHDYQTKIAAGGADSKHPGIWLSSASRVTFENLSITACLPVMVGTDSSRDPAGGPTWDSVFDNVGLFASQSAGCGPGLRINSSSGRNFIRHSQIRGSELEQTRAATISRRDDVVTLHATANLPSSWKTGTTVGVDGVIDPSFDGGDFTIAVTSAKTLTYPQAGPNAASSGGRAAADGSQSIVLDPHGAQGNSLYVDDLSLYDGAIKVYAGATSTTLKVVKVEQDQGFGPPVWVVTCLSPTLVNPGGMDAAPNGTNTSEAMVRSGCPKAPIDRSQTQTAATVGQPPPPGAAALPKTIASPPPSQKTQIAKSQVPPPPSTAAPHASSGSAMSGPVAPVAHPSKGVAPSATGHIRGFGVQVGAFRDPANADRLKARIGASYGPVVILRTEQGNGVLYRVCVGRESSEAAAHELAEKLRSAKFTDTTMVVSVN